jgi:hypothetical protein
VLTKTWDYYHMRLIEAGRLPPRPAAKTASRGRAKPAAKPAARVAAKKKKRR